MFSWIPNSWHWLVNEGALRDIVAVAAGVFVTPALTWLVIRPAKRFMQVQKDIADKLDTSTPGGLTDLMNAMQGGTMGNTGSGPGGDSGGT